MGDQKKPINKKHSNGKQIVNDPRFQSVHSDPRFSKVRRGNLKVKVDERFKSLKEDKDFKTTASVDKYGRKLDQDKSAKEIEKLYDVEDKESSSEESEPENENEKKVSEEDLKAEEEEEESEEEESSEEEDEDEEPVFDPARGEGLVSTSESDESDEESEAEAQPEVTELAGLETEDRIPRGTETSRLAVVNMDWDNIQAVDLFAALSSFCPPSGKLKKVSIYPSEFGKQRLSVEHVQGPPREIFTPKSGNSSSNDLQEAQEYGFDEKEESESDDDQAALVEEDLGAEFDMVKLRQYQLERLRYFYAVVECDKVRTAKAIYDACDGAEFETTANIYDLRFIPDDVSFEEDEPREVCTKIPEKYEPREFVTDALQHSKVKLSWDADDPNRKNLIKKAFTSQDLEDLDFSAYVASSESEDEDVDELRTRYQKLLNGDGGDEAERNPFEEPGKPEGLNGDMEVTFTSGLDEKEDKGGEEDETTIEKYKRKAAERKQRRKELRKVRQEEVNGEKEEDLGFDDPFFQGKGSVKNGKKKSAKPTEVEEDPSSATKEELEAIVKEDANDSEHLDHFDMKSILKAEKSKKGRKQKKKAAELEGLQEGFEVNVSDPRFEALYSNHNFAMDPTNPHFKKTKTTEKILGEGLKRRGHLLEQAEEGKVEKNVKKRGSVKQDKGEDLNRIVQSIKRAKKSLKMKILGFQVNRQL
ncbi:pre-rRNA processing protein Esf1 [Schizosaccharomyces cryophilus OY26]|uniref:Pre-rRNA processing protein Esf1 n=1 Tax=Schizosaccharomyces cryophilus (strain OY26 / ATCC MYA-4695 / CBS 11777 / NBRC 106824 / NRRL Y48691) TaxID=653667 RepID=S9WXK5_SCHCR|nr:pre-rRNA processing protein Esf1 [Schizosaccharomyces cryophilus OY26]EPY49412.1 pre-rRNA processing protein Esf1 [Schizosaccharomyces cryophilus OY26]